MIKLVIAV